MPRLKKYSQIYGDETASNAFLIQTKNNDGKQQQSSDHENSNTNLSKSQTSSSGDSNSENQNLSSKGNQISEGQKRKKNINQKMNEDIRKNIGKKKKESKYNADEILKRIQEQLANNQEIEDHKQYDDNQTGIQIPDDALVGFEKKKSKNKKNKNQIKSKNKFFNFQASQDIQQKAERKEKEQNGLELKQLEQERKKLLQAKNFRQSAVMDARKNKLESKVNKIRERMQFKNAHQDVRYKQHIKQALEGVKDCEQVQIMIEAPKIFKGSTARHTDAALYLKNMSQNTTPQSQALLQDSRSRSLACEEQKNQQKNKSNKLNKNVDRKQFYEEVGKKAKQTKIFDFKAQPSGIFKKSSLDELGQEFQKNAHLFKQNQSSRRSFSNASNRSLSHTSKIRISGQGKTKSTQISEFKLDQKSQGYSKKIYESVRSIQVVQQDQSNQDSKNAQIQLNASKIIIKASVQLETQNQKRHNKPSQSKESETKEKKKINQLKPSNTKKDKKKSGKNKNKKQKVSKQIRQLFEQEAEDSQNGYGDDGHSSGSGDSQSVQSLIDRNDIKYVQKYERQAMRKFMEQQHRRDDLIIQKIKEKITNPRKIKCQQSSESRQRRKRRMIDAKKKFEQEDGNDNEIFFDGDKETKEKNNNAQQQNDDFEKQLRNFEDEICIKQTEKQDSKSAFSRGIFEKNKIQWKQIKTANKSGKNLKRGGFVNEAKVIIGPKIKSRKSTSKPKNINF